MARTRQLAAIMCTDIDGYDSLIQQDESLALELKDWHREVLFQAAEKFHGKILHNIGHDSLSLFNSAVEAVQCAIEMQLTFREATAVPVKISVHLGDIIYSGEEAIGEGITIARKIQTLSPAGGILISNKIFEEVRNQSGIKTRFFKACELDEEGERVKVYTIANEGIAVPQGILNKVDSERGDHPSGSGIRFFWEEAKRRKVIRVIVMYAGAAFVISELVSNVSDPLRLPDWLQTTIILALIAGFPVTALLSWIFDLTPEGIRRTKPVEELEVVEPDCKAHSDASWFIRKKVLRRYLVPLLVAGLFVWFYFFKDRLFQNWERVNKVALEHTRKANLYLFNYSDPELVKRELDLALEEDPDYDSALYTYALLHRLEGDTVLAKQKLRRVVDLNPGYSNAWDLLATFAFKQDSFDLAMGYSILAMEADPQNTFAAYNLACQSEDRGLYDQAVAYFKMSTQMDSTFTAGYSALGSLYNKMNRPTDAIFTLRKSLRISPASIDNYMIFKNLAEAHFLLKEYDSTLEYLEKSKALDQGFPETEKCFARYYEATGDLESSILHWRRYLALETDTLELRRAQEQLDSLRSQGPEE